MSLDPRYVTSVDLNPYLVDKDTGAPLAGGSIEFYQDDNRNVGKLVYMLSGAPPNYTYTALPNPVILSASGTIEDSNGANVALYYYPYSSINTDADVQLYYVVVKNSSGVIQFTRDAWPNISAESSPGAQSNNTNINQLSNPQFVNVFFDTNSTLSLSFSGSGTDTYSIAPDWDLIVGHSGDGSLSVLRSSIVGASAYPTNPPYAMTFTPGINVTSVKLSQRLNHNPSVWSADDADNNGYIGTNIVLGPDNQSVSIVYKPSLGSAQTLLAVTNDTGLYKQFSNTVQLDVASNSSNSDAGYVDIIISMPAAGATTLTSVQVVGLEDNIPNLKFNQAPVNRQLDQLFHYYQPYINAKPINSYLVGWDFPLNPAQFGSTVTVKSTGNNTSNYIWDQTICFQSIDASVSFARSTIGALVATAAANTQIALIQYLEPPLIREIFNNRLSVNLSAFTSQSAGVNGTVTLWYCDDANLPDMNANTSLVFSIDSGGTPLAANGSWTKITRTFLPDATFTIPQNIAVNSSLFTDVGLSGWDIDSDATAIASATYFAIVVGFEELTSSKTITFNSISLVPGEIPTRPAPLSFDETLYKCERYYEKTYDNGVYAGAMDTDDVFSGFTVPQSGSIKNSANNVYTVNSGFCVTFLNVKWKNISNVVFYSPYSGSINSMLSRSEWGGNLRSVDISSGTFRQDTISTKRAVYIPSSGTSEPTWSPSGIDTVTPPATWLQMHYIVDSRLGIV